MTQDSKEHAQREADARRTVAELQVRSERQPSDTCDCPSCMQRRGDIVLRLTLIEQFALRAAIYQFATYLGKATDVLDLADVMKAAVLSLTTKLGD